ncbi:MAG: hypothetical protein WC455_12255 [Dehalococcoidia bacterium]|jgi:hypothetical protein
MAVGKATGYGNNSTARNVFKCTFNHALSSAVKYEAYDNDETFPTLDTVVTTANDILAGTAGNSTTSMVCLVDTTNAAPDSDWKPASATAGTANPNRLKGTTSYVTQAGAVRGDNEAITWNMVIEIPSDATTAMAFGFDLLLRYTYTGTAPTLTWAYNTGTEGSANWVTMTPGTDGMLHCRTGSGGTGDGHYYANIPAADTEDTVECWIDQNTTA